MGLNAFPISALSTIKKIDKKDQNFSHLKVVHGVFTLYSVKIAVKFGHI